MAERLIYLDNLRFALTILVIFHHTAVAYGGIGNWSYKSRHHSSSLPLMVFNGLAQSFFMGAFFFLAGIFSRIARERKGSSSFVRDKLLRLMLPAVIYTLIAEPLQDLVLEVFLHHRAPSMLILTNHLRVLQASPGIRGPVWFSTLLCIFDCCYALICSLRTALARTSGMSPGQSIQPAALLEKIDTLSYVLGILLCGLVEFIVRLRFPTSYMLPLLNLRIGYLPQYVFLYTFGLRVEASKVELLPRFSLQTISAVISTGVAVFISLKSKAGAGLVLADFEGGLNISAAAYAILNEFVGFAFLATSFHYFRSHCNSRSCKALTRLSYAMFMAHAPVSTAVEAVADDWMASAVVKTVVLGTVNCACSAAAGWLLKKLPGAASVL